MTRSRALTLVFSLLALTSAAGAAEQPTRIPAAAARNEKQLWRQVMAEFYGHYDKKRSCWVSTGGEQSYCMRPQELTRIGNGGEHLLFLSVSGAPVAEDNTCHACTGSLGLMVLRDAGKTLSLVARSEPYMESGSYGEPPDAEAVSVRRLGEPGNYGWAIDQSWMGQGIAVTSTELFGIVDGRVKSLGLLPVAYSDEDNCENGRNVETDEKCSDVTFELVYGAGAAPEPFMPITMKGKGTLKGEPFTASFTASFDKKAMTYEKPADLPPEVTP